MTSGSETRKRRNRLTVRFTDQELDRLAEIADRAGITLSSYARKTLVDSDVPRAARRPPVEKALLAKTLGELGKIGSKVNQIARALHSSGQLPNVPGVGADLHRIAIDLTLMRNAILAALGRGRPE